MRRVVISGLGVYSCIGTDVEAVKDSLYKGRSGIIVDQERKDFGYRSGLTGMVPKPILKGKLDRRQRVGLAEQAEYAFLATDQALNMAKLDNDYMTKFETGLIYGNDSSAKATIEAVDKLREKKDTTLLGSGSIFQGMNSTVTMNLSTIFKVTGMNITLSAACASGSHSIGLAYMLIKNGMQDRVICGGAQEINKFAMASFDGLSAFSIRENNPHEASRPFDKDRDGLVPSGGAATVILESYESAVHRGAPILAEVIGYGFSSNGAHISKPSIEGPIKSLQRALQDAGIRANEVDYINAHATSTPVGDKSEAESIDSVFGDARPWVSSTKSMTGHECWMAGASEIVYSVLMMQNDFIAPNINFSNPDEASARLKIADKTLNLPIQTLLSNSFGFGGTNSALILRKINS